MNNFENYIGRYWEKAENNKILCKLCPRHCLIAEGNRGFCFVRKNIEGKLVLTTYGRSSGFCIDPIEKKPLNHFYPGTSVLSFGTAGCNLGCKFCQNWDLSRSKEYDRLIEQASPEMIAKAAKNTECKSVAFTYNDPIIFMEYAIDIAKECHKQNIKTVAVTAGYIEEEPCAEFFKYIDAANVDLKAFSDTFYERLALGKLQPVLDTLLYIKKETNVWLEITTLLIPQENDSDEEINKMTEWIVNNLGNDVPLHFSAFHPDYKLNNYQPTPISTLDRARNIALSNGLNYVFTGNVHDKNGGSTFCSNCKKLLIERDWYELGQYHLKNKNQCEYCGTICAGYFDDVPGNRGAKRQPIQIPSV